MPSNKTKIVVSKGDAQKLSRDCMKSRLNNYKNVNNEAHNSIMTC